MNHRLYWFAINLARNNKINRLIVDLLALAFYKIFRSNKYFLFQGRKYPYFYHLYNSTVASERVVEIPIVHQIWEEYRGKKILEVGNVLSHYFPTKHDVLDKYEKGPGVINEDVATFKTNKKYDLILSISTMEHVGFSYGEKRDPDKFLKGMKNLKKHLAKEGKIVITFTLFFNPDLTKLVKNRKTPFNKEYFLKRNSFLNEWIEIGFKEAMRGNDYDAYYANSNVLFIGIFEK